MAKTKSARSTVKDKIVLAVIALCIALILVFQIRNAANLLRVTPVPTRAISAEDFVGFEIEEEDLVHETPLPGN